MRNDGDEVGVDAGLEVDPPEWWQQDSPLGFLGRDSTRAGRLVRVADLVRWVQSARGVPRASAVDLMCQAIQPGVMASLYVLSKHGGYAEPLEDGGMYGWLTRGQAERAQAAKNIAAMESAHAVYVSRGKQDGITIDAARPYGYSESPPPESYCEHGWPALVKRMRADWTSPTLAARAKRSSGVDVDSLDDERSSVARVAILASKANELLCYGTVAGAAVSEAVRLAESAAAEVLAIVQPIGGQWPHRKGESWNDAEREAMFLMRHRDKIADADLERIVGAKRQMINSLIGPTRPSGRLSEIEASSRDWKPSAALLRQCDAPLQSLQNVVATLAG